MYSLGSRSAGFRSRASLLSSLSVPPALVTAALTVESFDPGLLRPREKVPYSFSQGTSESPCRRLLSQWPDIQSSISGVPIRLLLIHRQGRVYEYHLKPCVPSDEARCGYKGAGHSLGLGHRWTGHHFQQRKFVKRARLCLKCQALQTVLGSANSICSCK